MGSQARGFHWRPASSVLVDAFDAMTTDRAYRPALTAESALKQIENGSGREFDPRCAVALLRIVRRRGLREMGGATDLFASGRPVATNSSPNQAHRFLA
jgi:hypothetical protein